MKPFNPEEFLVLVVDDVVKNLQVIGYMLDDVGYATTFASSGPQALERIRTAQPDLILLDLMMPGMSGLEVCEQLRTDLDLRRIPVIFLTVSHEKEHVLQAFECGAVDYVTKPFNAPELLARVRTHLELKHTRDELEKALQELEQLAITDPLTGISNRRHLLRLTAQEGERARRHARPFSILMLDIDHFKRINDTHGHTVGDHALLVMAQAVMDSLRREDCFGRLGGEEFVALLPETEIQAAVEVGDRIRCRIADLVIPVEAHQLSMTVSIGVSTYRFDDTAIEMVLQRADEALYRAKRQGRNQVAAHPTDCLLSE